MANKKTYELEIKGVKAAVDDIKSLTATIDTLLGKFNKGKISLGVEVDDGNLLRVNDQIRDVISSINQGQTLNIDSNNILELNKNLNLTEKQMKTLQQETEKQNAIISNPQGAIEIQRQRERTRELTADIKQQAQGTQDWRQFIESDSASFNELKTQLSAAKRELGFVTEGTQQFKDMAAEVGRLNDRVKAAETSYGSFGRNVGNYEGQALGLKTELRNLQTQMQQMLVEGRGNEEEYQKLQEKAGQYKDAIGDASLAVKRFAQDSRGMADVLTIQQTLASGFGAVNGALYLFGERNAEVEEAMKKTMQITQLVNGINTIYVQTQTKGTIISSLYQKALQLLGIQQTKNLQITTQVEAQEGRQAIAVTAQSASTVANVKATQSDTAATATNTLQTEANSQAKKQQTAVQIATTTSTTAQTKAITANSTATVQSTATVTQTGGAFKRWAATLIQSFTAAGGGWKGFVAAIKLGSIQIGTAIKTIPVIGWLIALQAQIAGTVIWIKRVQSEQQRQAESSLKLQDQIKKVRDAMEDRISMNVWDDIAEKYDELMKKAQSQADSVQITSDKISDSIGQMNKDFKRIAPEIDIDWINLSPDDVLKRLRELRDQSAYELGYLEEELERINSEIEAGTKFYGDKTAQSVKESVERQIEYWQRLTNFIQTNFPRLKTAYADHDDALKKTAEEEKKHAEEAKKQADKVRDAVKKLREEVDTYSDTARELQEKVIDIRIRQNTQDVNDSLTAEFTDIDRKIEKIVDGADFNIIDFKSNTDNIQNLKQNLIDLTTSAIQRVEQERDEALSVEEKKYNELRQQAKKYGKDTTLIDENYQKIKTAIAEQTQLDISDINNELQKRLVGINQKEEDAEKRKQQQIITARTNALKQYIEDVQESVDGINDIERDFKTDEVPVNKFLGTPTPEQIRAYWGEIEQELRTANEKITAKTKELYDKLNAEGLSDEEKNLIKQQIKDLEKTISKNNKQITSGSETAKKQVADSWENITNTVQTAVESQSSIQSGFFNLVNAKQQAELDILKSMQEEATTAQELQTTQAEEGQSKIDELTEKVRSSTGARKRMYADELKQQVQNQELLIREEKKQQQAKLQLDKQAEDAEKAQKKREQNQQMISQVIDTQSVILHAALTKPFIPMGLIAVQTATALGALQIQTISANKNKLGDGGIIDGRSHAAGGVPVGNTGIEVEGGEWVINKRSSAANSKLLAQINDKRGAVHVDDLKPFIGNNAVRKQTGGGQIQNIQTADDTTYLLREMVNKLDSMDIQPVVSVVDITTGIDRLNQVRTMQGFK